VTSTVLDPIADGIVAVVQTLSPTVKARKWVVRDTDARPAAVVELPTVNRTDVDANEDHLGEYDWRSEWPVSFYFDFTDTAFGQAQALEVVEKFVSAIDADPTLGGTVQEAKVVTAGPPQIEEGYARPMLVYPTRVDVLDFVA
jgi:hypothetical protein